MAREERQNRRLALVGADVVVRFQGGTTPATRWSIDGTVAKLALLPSGIVRPGELSVIGNGVVLDPYDLVAEVEQSAARMSR